MGLLINGMCKRLRGFPQPYSDEILSSWLLRCASSHRCVISIADVECYVETAERNSIDYDFSLGALFKRFCLRFRLNFLYCKAFFSVDAIDKAMILKSRRSFCRQCLDEDVARRSMPYWRRSWCRFDVAYCLKHNALLTTTREDFGLYRAWESFAYFPYFDYTHNSDRVNHEYAKFDPLGLKVQVWLYTHRKFIERNLAASKLISDMLSSFLSLRTERRQCGIARVAFSYGSQIPITYREYHYSLCMYYGARTSNSCQRKAALIALGVVLGLFDERQLKTLMLPSPFTCGIFPVNAKQAGRTVQELLSTPEREWYASLFLHSPVIGGLDTHSRIEEFLTTIRSSERGR